MSLLNKFEDIKVDTTKTLLRDEDAKAINDIEEHFSAAFAFHENHIEFYNINMEYSANPFLSLNEEIEAIQKEVAKLAIKRVEKIVNWFSSKYKITLNEKEIKELVLPENDYHTREKEKEKGIPALTRIQKFKFPVSKILEQIQAKLGGLSLDEVSEKEIKENFWKAYARAYHRGYGADRKLDPSVTLTKNRLEFERGPYIDPRYNGGFEFQYSSGVEKLSIALSYFEIGSKEILKELDWMRPYGKVLDAYSEIELPLTKTKSIRFYKNRKMVIKFQNNETAEEFFRVWCRNGIAEE